MNETTLNRCYTKDVLYYLILIAVFISIDIGFFIGLMVGVNL